MKLTFLGTGTSQGVPVIGCECEVCRSDDPRDHRLRSSVLVEASGVSILIDGGPDLRQQLLRANVNRLDAVLITHEHQDHVAGLDDLRPLIFAQQRDMPIYAMPRVCEDIRTRYSYAFAETKYPGVPRFELHEFELGAKIDLADMSIQSIPIRHGKLPISGFKIGQMAYLTDMSDIDGLSMQYLSSLDLLILDCLRRDPHYSHTHLDGALAWAEKLQPERCILTHVGHKLGNMAHLDRELPDHVSVAYDGLQVTW